MQGQVIDRLPVSFLSDVTLFDDLMDRPAPARGPSGQLFQGDGHDHLVQHADPAPGMKSAVSCAPGRTTAPRRQVGQALFAATWALSQRRKAFIRPVVGPGRLTR